MKKLVHMNATSSFVVEVNLPDNWDELSDDDKLEYLELSAHELAPSLCGYCTARTPERSGIDLGEWEIDTDSVNLL